MIPSTFAHSEPQDGGFSTPVSGCARCGDDHDRVTFAEFQHNPHGQYEWWGMCPALQEPILLRIAVDMGDA